MTEPPAAKSLYHPIILEHDRNPRGERPLPAATHQAALDNPLCGDQVTMRLRVDGDRIVEAAFEARGCAVSRAAASLWTERLTGCSLAEATDLLERYARFCAEPPEAPMDEALGELIALAGVRAARSRRLCATLPSRALEQALGKP